MYIFSSFYIQDFHLFFLVFFVFSSSSHSVSAVMLGSPQIFLQLSFRLFFLRTSTVFMVEFQAILAMKIEKTDHVGATAYSARVFNLQESFRITFLTEREMFVESGAYNAAWADVHLGHLGPRRGFFSERQRRGQEQCQREQAAQRTHLAVLSTFGVSAV